MTLTSLSGRQRRRYPAKGASVLQRWLPPPLAAHQPRARSQPEIRRLPSRLAREPAHFARLSGPGELLLLRVPMLTRREFGGADFEGGADIGQRTHQRVAASPRKGRTGNRSGACLFMVA